MNRHEAIEMAVVPMLAYIEANRHTPWAQSLCFRFGDAIRAAIDETKRHPERGDDSTSTPAASAQRKEGDALCSTSKSALASNAGERTDHSPRHDSAPVREAARALLDRIYDTCGPFSKSGRTKRSGGQAARLHVGTQVRYAMRALESALRSLPLLAPRPDSGVKKAQRDVFASVIAERNKQRLKWGDSHDAGHSHGELARNAAELAANGTDAQVFNYPEADPWGLIRKHPNRREQLVIAAALIVAEIERRDAADRVEREGKV